MDTSEGDPVIKISIIKMEFNQGSRLKYPNIMKNPTGPSGTTPGQDFRFKCH